MDWLAQCVRGQCAAVLPLSLPLPSLLSSMPRSLLSMQPLYRRIRVPYPSITPRPTDNIRVRWLTALHSPSSSSTHPLPSHTTSSSSQVAAAAPFSSSLRPHRRFLSSQPSPFLSPPRRWLSTSASHHPGRPPLPQALLSSPSFWVSVLLVGVAVTAFISDAEVLKDRAHKSASVLQRAIERRQRRKKSESRGGQQGGALKENTNDDGEHTTEHEEGGRGSGKEMAGEANADEEQTSAAAEEGVEQGKAEKDEGEKVKEKEADEEKAKGSDETEGTHEGANDGSDQKATDSSAEPQRKADSGGEGDHRDEQGISTSDAAGKEGQKSPPPPPLTQTQKTVVSGSGDGHQRSAGAAEPKHDETQKTRAPSQREADDGTKESEEAEDDEGHRTPPPLTDEESAADAAHLSAYYSAPRDEHPHIPNLRILTANRIDAVLQSSPPFFLYLYDPTCAACALYSPIINALAYALDTRDSTSPPTSPSPSPLLLVYSMNDATDYKPGFLTPDEERALPLLKFFPQNSNQPPLVYNGSPHLSSLLSFLHRHSEGAFDLPRALERVKSRLPQLRKEVEERGKARLERSEDWMLFLGSPCGRWIREYSVSELRNKYVEGEVEGEGEKEAEAKYERFVQCMEEQEEESLDYFETMQHIAAETVSEMRKRRAKRQMEGRKDNVKEQPVNAEEGLDEEEVEKWNKPL